MTESLLDDFVRCFLQANGRDRSFPTPPQRTCRTRILEWERKLMFAESAIRRKWVWPLCLARARNGEECCFCRYKRAEEVS